MRQETCFSASQASYFTMQLKDCQRNLRAASGKIFAEEVVRCSELPRKGLFSKEVPRGLSAPETGSATKSSNQLSCLR
jgi:hypothetical protein